MNRRSARALTLLLMLGPIGAPIAFGHHIKTWTVVTEVPPAPGPAKLAAPDAVQPTAASQPTIIYEANLSTSTATGALLSYCVYPSIHFANGLRGAGQDLMLALVNKTGAPAAAGFDPFSIRLLPPISPNATVELNAKPSWCADIPGARTAPEVYLQIDNRRVRVEFPKPAGQPTLPLK